MSFNRIHITGASGSGTTTLGQVPFGPDLDLTRFAPTGNAHRAQRVLPDPRKGFNPPVA